MDNVRNCSAASLHFLPDEVPQEPLQHVKLSTDGLVVRDGRSMYTLTPDLKLVENGIFYNKTLADLSRLERFTLSFPDTKITVETEPGKGNGPRKIDNIVTLNSYGATVVRDAHRVPCEAFSQQPVEQYEAAAAIDANHHDGQRIDIEKGMLSSAAHFEPGHKQKMAHIASLGNSGLTADELIELADIGWGHEQALRHLMDGRTVGGILGKDVPKDTTGAELLMRVVDTEQMQGRPVRPELLELVSSMALEQPRDAMRGWPLSEPAQPRHIMDGTPTPPPPHPASFPWGGEHH
jgi:hypothetical protein